MFLLLFLALIASKSNCTKDECNRITNMNDYRESNCIEPTCGCRGLFDMGECVPRQCNVYRIVLTERAYPDSPIGSAVLIIRDI